MSDAGEERMITVYDAVGGDAYFVDLVDRFYDKVMADPVLIPLYRDDVAEASRKTALFLIQYWGGPSTYNDERGHPRLRMRHNPFVIGQAERDAWLTHMMASIDERPLQPEVRELFSRYFEHASTAMMNHP
ncbi:MAG: globin [Acidimicrobiales bacterium]